MVAQGGSSGEGEAPRSPFRVEGVVGYDGAGHRASPGETKFGEAWLILSSCRQAGLKFRVMPTISQTEGCLNISQY